MNEEVQNPSWDMHGGNLLKLQIFHSSCTSICKQSKLDLQMIKIHVVYLSQWISYDSVPVLWWYVSAMHGHRPLFWLFTTSTTVLSIIVTHVHKNTCQDANICFSIHFYIPLECSNMTISCRFYIHYSCIYKVIKFLQFHVLTTMAATTWHLKFECELRWCAERLLSFGGQRF